MRSQEVSGKLLQDLILDGSILKAFGKVCDFLFVCRQRTKSVWNLHGGVKVSGTFPPSPST
jgi:hypothetical protein